MVRAFRLVEPAVDLCQDEIGFLFDGDGGVVAGDVHDDAAIDFAFVHALEDVVDVFELLGLGVSVDQTFAGEGESLGQIQTGAHDGAANGESLEYHLKDGKGEGAWGQAVERDGGARTGHADGLGEGRVWRAR